MMKRKITGKLERVERRPNSYYGNPRFALTVGDITRLTGQDASINYEVTNYRVGREVTITLEGRSIIDMAYADGRKA